MKIVHFTLLAAIAATVPLRLGAIDVSGGAIALGEWNKNFAEARALAESNHIPMLVMWARTSCPRCVACKTAMSQDNFLAWQRERQLVMALVHEGELGNGYALGLIRQGNRGLSDLPLLCIYWLKPDGSTVLRSFVGRDGNGTLPVRKGGSVAMQIAQSVDFVLAEAGWSGTGSAVVVPVAPPQPRDPQFADGNATITLTQHISAEWGLSLTNLTGGSVKVKKLSGKLPNGLKATYSAESGKLRLAGIPTKPGTYLSSWRITEKRTSGSVSGDSQTITCVVEPLASRNPAIGSAGINTSGFVEADTGEVAGTLMLQARPNGKVSLKYVGRTGNATLASRAWSGISEDGTLSATAVGKDGSSLEMTIAADGTVSSRLRIKNEPKDMSPQFQFPPWSKAYPATAYVGSQTVPLAPPNNGASGSLTVKLPSGGARNGKMTYRGKLPNGRSISGNGILVENEDGETARLPVLKVTRGSTVSGILTFNAITGTLLDGYLLERSADGTLLEIGILSGEGLR